MRHNSFQDPPLKTVPSSEPEYLRLMSLVRMDELCSQGSITPVINFVLINIICSDSIFTQPTSDCILGSYVVLPADSVKTIFQSK